jgi:hypothetical protein
MSNFIPVPGVSDRQLNTIIFRECFVRYPDHTWEKLCRQYQEFGNVEAQFKAFNDILSEVMYEPVRWYNPRRKRGELAPQRAKELLLRAADWVIESLIHKYERREKEVLLQFWEHPGFPHSGNIYTIEDSRQAEQRRRAKELVALLDGQMDKWLHEMEKLKKMATTVKVYQDGKLIIDAQFPAR